MNSKIGRKHIVIAAGALAVLIAGAEWMARGHPSFTAGQAERDFARAVLEADAATGIRVRPNASITLDGIRYEFSELGTRSELPDDENTDPVVLVVGDSYGLGWKDSAQRPWPMRVERRGRALGLRIHVINAAVPGANIESHVARVEQLVDTVKPAVVVVGHSPDDAAAVAKAPGLFDWALPSIIGEFFAGAPRNTANWFTSLHVEGGKGMERVERAYERLGNTCREKELTCLVALLSPRIAEVETFAPIRGRFESMAERVGLHILHATGSLEANPASWALEPGDPRPGEEGHDRIGALVAAWLLEEKVLPRASPPSAGTDPDAAPNAEQPSSTGTESGAPTAEATAD